MGYGRGRGGHTAHAKVQGASVHLPVGHSHTCQIVYWRALLQTVLVVHAGWRQLVQGLALGDPQEVIGSKSMSVTTVPSTPLIHSCMASVACRPSSLNSMRHSAMVRHHERLPRLHPFKREELRAESRFVVRMPRPRRPEHTPDPSSQQESTGGTVLHGRRRIGPRGAVQHASVQHVHGSLGCLGTCPISSWPIDPR